MNGTFSGEFQYGNAVSLTVPAPPAPDQRAQPGTHRSEELARRLFAWESLAPDAQVRGDGATEPFSLQWFLDIETLRLSRQARWIPRLLEFSKHAGETLLGMGSGLGTDWLQYARHGALVVVCSPDTGQLSLARRNFELRGLSGRFLHAPPASLPIEACSIDVVCVDALLSDSDDPQQVVDEVYRVLKPGGKVMAVAPARCNVDFWFHLCFPWNRWLYGRRSRHVRTGPAFTGRSLRQLFARFINHRVYKRQLRRADVPHIWRWMPLPLLERLMGNRLILKAFKPLSAAMGNPAAA